jgi:hypothetical protein
MTNKTSWYHIADAGKEIDEPEEPCDKRPCILETVLTIFGSKPCDDCKRMGLNKEFK